MPDVLMPRLSDTMTEGIVVQWRKQEGESVQRGDVIAEVETDKATMEIEAYDSGVLTRILAEPGSTVPIGEPIAVIGGGTEAGPAAGPTLATPGNTEPPRPKATVQPPPGTSPAGPAGLLPMSSWPARWPLSTAST